MKNITKFTCLALGVALVTTASSAFAEAKSGDCCMGKAATPMADAAKPDAKAKPYPLDTCIVSDEKLGEMGKPYVFAHKGQEIKLCCKSCLKKFDKDPAKFLKKLEEASKADKK